MAERRKMKEESWREAVQIHWALEKVKYDLQKQANPESPWHSVITANSTQTFVQRTQN